MSQNRLRSVLLVVFVAAVITSLLGYLINQLPAIPNFRYKNWWIVGGVVVLTIAAALIAFWQGQQDAALSGNSGTETPAPQPDRLRKALLDKVHHNWIQGVLERSLYAEARLVLGFEERPDAVHPWGMEWMTPQQERRVLPAGTRVIDQFDTLGEGATLLILGEPGSGKTTTLLELARDLIDRARLDAQTPLPVVLNLSSWGKQPTRSASPSFADWLVEELLTNYQVSKSLAQTWIQQEQLLLLLDGLDEVRADRRSACVDAINQFRQTHGTIELVVCCRIRDYDALSTRLRFQAALYIQALTPQQINYYLNQAGEELAGIRTALQVEPVLQEVDPNSLRSLAASPLFLWVMVVAYRGMSAEEILDMDSRNRRQHIFNEYIKSQLEPCIGYRRSLDSPYPAKQVKHWMQFLAHQMFHASQTIFLIEEIQPIYLPNKKLYTEYLISVRLIILLIGLPVGVLIGVLIGAFNELIEGLLVGLFFGAASGIFFGLLLDFFNVSRIILIETLNWSWRKSRLGLLFVPFGGLFFGLLFGLLYGLAYGLFAGLFGSLLCGIFFGLLFGLHSTKIEHKVLPNQGVWQTVQNAIASGLIVWLISGPLSLGIFGGAIIEQFNGLSAALLLYILFGGLLIGFYIGLMFGLTKGGLACIQHFALRLTLFRYSYIPWNYAHFLDWASDRLLLQKVGGGYIFIHRLLLEHFAQMR